MQPVLQWNHLAPRVPSKLMYVFSSSALLQSASNGHPAPGYPTTTPFWHTFCSPTGQSMHLNLYTPPAPPDHATAVQSVGILQMRSLYLQCARKWEPYKTAEQGNRRPRNICKKLQAHGPTPSIQRGIVSPTLHECATFKHSLAWVRYQGLPPV